MNSRRNPFQKNFYTFRWSIAEGFRGARQAYKRVEAILTTQSVTAFPAPSRRKRQRTSFLSIPVTRTQFIKRDYDNPEHFSNKSTFPSDREAPYYKSPPLIHGRIDGERSSSSSSSGRSTTNCSACASRDEVEILYLSITFNI